MTTRTVFTLLLFFASIYSAQANEVSSIRCNGKFVQPGMDKFQVIALCGAPKASEVISGEDEPKVERLERVNLFGTNFVRFSFESKRRNLVEASRLPNSYSI